MKIIVCGGRNFIDVPLLWQTLDRVDIKEGPIPTVIEGASDDVTGPYKGADYWANKWALARGREAIRVHANWEDQGKAAGPIRNQRMLTECKPDLVVAFPGGAGTANMVDLARKAGVRVMEIDK